MSDPMSSDVPAPSRLRVGDGVVDLSTREISMPGARGARRVTPKAIGVLRMLARVPGTVVGRGELLEQVWPDTLPTDDVLTQAITQLRKAFGAGDAGAAAGKRYIETIAKGGYRLTVEVEVLASEHEALAMPVRTTDPAFQAVPGPADATPVHVPVASLRGGIWRRWLPVGLALLLVLIAGLGLWTASETARLPAGDASGSAGPAPVSRPYRLITAGEGFALSPSLSPDASMVAYSATGRMGGSASSSAIVIQTTTSAVPRAVSRPPPDASDDLPAWSPDGREIAFARWHADGACRVMLVAATGGDEREVARCDRSDLLSFDWLPDGSSLLFGTMTGADEAARLRILDPVSGRWRALDYAGAPGDIDYAPRVSPDGRWIGFIRNPQMGDLWRVPIDGGAPEQITRLGAELLGWDWTPDSTGMVFGLRVDSEARLYRADVAGGALVDLGIEDAQAPSISTRNGMLAFVHRQPRFGLYRIDAHTGDWQRLFASAGRDAQPTLAPDGRQIVFTSDRAGRFELWWARLDAPDALRPIEGVRPDTRQAPVWSPDGRSLLLTALGEDNLPMILEVEPASGRVERLEVPARQVAQAAFGPDHSLLIVEGISDGGTRLVSYDRRTWRRGGSIDGASQVRYDAAHDRVLYTRIDANGLWMAAPDLSAESIVRLDDQVPTRWRYRSWSVDAAGIAYLDATNACWSRITRYRVEESLKLAAADAGACLDPVTRSATNGLAATQDEWFVSLASDDGSAIGFMPLPMPARKREVDFLAKWLNLMRNKIS